MSGKILQVSFGGLERNSPWRQHVAPAPRFATLGVEYVAIERDVTTVINNPKLFDPADFDMLFANLDRLKAAIQDSSPTYGIIKHDSRMKTAHNIISAVELCSESNVGESNAQDFTLSEFPGFEKLTLHQNGLVMSVRQKINGAFQTKSIDPLSGRIAALQNEVHLLALQVRVARDPANKADIIGAIQQRANKIGTELTALRGLAERVRADGVVVYRKCWVLQPS